MWMWVVLVWWGRGLAGEGCVERKGRERVVRSTRSSKLAAGAGVSA